MRDGTDWLVDGQKIFTSNAQNADWIWLACRTDPQAPKHKGISIILVPTSDPGFSWTPIDTVGGLTTTATYYDSVRVPAGHLVGPEHGGWGLITNQLNHERVALAAIGMQAEDFYEHALRHARTTDPDTGERPADLPGCAPGSPRPTPGWPPYGCSTGASSRPWAVGASPPVTPAA